MSGGCLSDPLLAQQASRRPRGIYAVVNIEENIKKEQAANPSITPAELQAYFVNLYQDLLGNPAVSRRLVSPSERHAGGWA